MEGCSFIFAAKSYFYAAKERKNYTMPRALALLCLVFLAAQLSAQSPHLESISIEQGLSQGFISDICQDSEGYLWFGTNSGLNRFDGYQFTVFKHDPYDPFSLPGDNVTALAEAGDFLCVLTLEGMSLMQRRSRRFYLLPQTKTLFRHTFCTLKRENDHTVWALSREYGTSLLYRISWAEPRRSVGGAAQLAQGKSWLEGVPLGEATVKVERKFEPLPVTGFSLSADGKILWLSTTDGQLHYQQLPTGTLTKLQAPMTMSALLPPGALGNQGVAVLSENHQTLMCFDLPKQAWQTWQIDGGQFEFLNFDTAKQTLWGIAGTEVWGFDLWKPPPAISRRHASHVLSVPEIALKGLTDRYGILWLGTNAKGIRKFNPNTGVFKNYLEKHSVNSQPFADSAGNIWLGKMDGDLFNRILDRSTGALRPYPVPEVMRDMFGANMVADSTGNFWFAGIHNGRSQPLLVRYEPASGKTESWVFPNECNGTNSPMRYDAAQNAVWIATARRLFRFDVASRQFATFDYSQLKLGCQPAHDLVQTADGSWWVALETGLLRIQPSSTAPSSTANHPPSTFFQNSPTDRNSLPANYVKSLLTDPADRHILWIGTAGRGLSRLDTRTNTFRHYTTETGLPDDVIYGILPDEENNLWLSTNKGLTCFTPSRGGGGGGSFRYFFKSDGLQDNEFNTHAFGKSAYSGELMFGGVNGLTVFHPKDLKANAQPPNVLISGLKINNLQLSPGDSSGLLSEGVEHTQALSLPHRKNNLTIQFFATDFTKPARNRFRFYLSHRDAFGRWGGEAEWSHEGFEHTAQYLNLPPGDYTFKVKGTNSEGVWNETPTTLRITIRPPWYGSWWAYAAYALLLAGGAWRFHRFQLARKLEHAETERLKDLDAFKSRFFTNITHEFRTPLTVILGISEQLLSRELGMAVGSQQWAVGSQQPEVRSKLGLIKRNGENLLRLINQILDLAKLQDNSLKINYVQGDVLPYLRYITESLHSLANAQNVMLKVESTEAQIVMDYDPERLLQIVHNLLSNAIKFTPSGGRVVLDIGILRYSDNDSRGDNIPISKYPNIRISISDTGVGIPPEDLLKVFDRFYQANNLEKAKAGGTGIGLSLTKELVKAMGGEISVESSTSPLGDRGVGTTFTVKLPITRNAQLASHPVTSPQLAENLGGTFPKPKAPLWGGTPSEKLPPKSDHEGKLSNHLLLIEDNPDVVEYLAACLGETYQLDFAYNGRAGIEKALETVPDLILSDVMMPEKDGFEVCDFLKNDERTSHIPIVLLTAKADVESRIAGLKRGADAYLAKPFHSEELLVTLANLLELRRKLQVKYGKLDIGVLRYSDIDGQTVGSTQYPIISISQYPPPDIEDAFLKKIRLCIGQNIGDTAFDGARLAKAMSLSEVQLYRKIKALTDKSTAIYIRSVRLHKGRELLLTTEMNVSEIAYEVGFDDPNYFSRTFSQEFGAPPSEVRK